MTINPAREDEEDLGEGKEVEDTPTPQRQTATNMGLPKATFPNHFRAED